MNFTKKYAIVTGGANGIGRCITERMLRAGVHVIIIDIDEQAGIALCNHHENLSFYHGDIADQVTLLAFIDKLKTPVDFIINNACISHGGLLSNCSWENFEYVQRVGVTAPYFLVSNIYKRDLLAKNASIVNIASTRALQSQADTESYSAAKGGILSLTHAMSISLAGQARVNAVSPGWIETAAYYGNDSSSNGNSDSSSNNNGNSDSSSNNNGNSDSSSNSNDNGDRNGNNNNNDSTAKHSGPDKRQHPAGRVGTPEDVAEMVMFLCDNSRAGFITGENIIIDGGMSKLMIYHNDNGWQFDG